MKWLDTLRVVPPVVDGKIDVLAVKMKGSFQDLRSYWQTLLQALAQSQIAQKPPLIWNHIPLNSAFKPRSQYVNTQMYFRNCAVQWFENNSVSKCMWKSNSDVVCSGTRNSSHRRFDNGFPLILPFNIDLLTANKTLNTVSDLPVNLAF